MVNSENSNDERNGWPAVMRKVHCILSMEFGLHHLDHIGLGNISTNHNDSLKEL